MDFAVPGDDRAKIKESEKINKYLDLAREQKTTVEHEIDGVTVFSLCVSNACISLRNMDGRIGN